MRLLLKKRPLISFLIFVSVLFTGWLLFGKKSVPDIDFIVAKRGVLLQEVSVTGNVEPAHAVDLAFENTGRIARMYADVGERVSAGQALLTLENSDAQAALQEAEAKVKIEEANLDELLRGAHPEEIRAQEIKVENARVAVEDSKKNWIDVIQDAFTKTDDAVRNKLDQIFANPQGGNYDIYFTIDDPQLESNVAATRVSVETMLDMWNTSLAEITIEGDLSSFHNEAKEHVSMARGLLDNAARAVNGAQAGPDISQATLDGYKADISTARTNVNTARSNLSAAEEEVLDNQASFAYEKQQLVVKVADPTEEDIRAQQATLEQVKATVATKKAALAKTILRAPLSGIVTKQKIEMGQIVTSGAHIMTLISDADFEIKVDIPETDITNVEVGDSANITLDAYGSDSVFSAHVVMIDPAETIIEGVVTYTTTLQFDIKDERVKPGMTANIDIVTDRRDDVISVPVRAILTENGQTIVRILEGDVIRKVPVTTGIRGSFADVEIISGVEEGDKVIIFVEED